METKPLTYCEAHDRMDSFMEDKRVIRVAMFRLKFTVGNETLIEKEE